MSAVVSARDADVFDRLYAELMQAWLLREELRERPTSLTELVDAEERYRTARTAMPRACEEWP